MKHLSEIVHCGVNNREGKLTPALLNESNLTTDWLKDFLFEGNVSSAKNGEYAGFVDLQGDGETEMLCYVTYTDYAVSYLFINMESLEEADIDGFIDAVHEFFADQNDDLDIVINYTVDDNGFGNNIEMAFFFRTDERK